MNIYCGCHKLDWVSLTQKSGFLCTNNKQINLLLNTVNELAAEFRNWSFPTSAPAWWKARELGEIKRYGGSAPSGQRWTMEKKLVPVGKVSAAAKMPPSNPLVSTHVPVMESMERSLFVVGLLASG